MGKRFFQFTTAELAEGKECTNNANFSLDEGVGAATRDARIVWDRGDGTMNQMDCYTEHPTDPSEIGNRSQMAVTLSSGINTGVVRINYEDTHGSDRVVAGIKAMREEIAASGNAIANWFTSKAQYDLVLMALRRAEMAFGSRGRDEAHIAANS